MDKTQKSKILEKVKMLYKMWKDGKLGGDYMLEDSNPHLIKSSRENFLYFTLPMALNYQRNSYKLWENALATFNDKTTHIHSLKRERDEICYRNFKRCNLRNLL